MIDTSEALPPHNSEAEKALLAVSVQYRESFLELQSHLRSEMFYDLRYAELWALMLDQESKHGAIDWPMMMSATQGNNALHPILWELPEMSVLPSMWRSYFHDVEECWQKRKVIHGAAEIEGMARNGHSLPDIAEATERLLRVETRTPPTQDGRECALKMVSDLERRYRLQGALSGIPTGLADLDNMTDGWQAKDFIIVGARPSIGKTALGLNFFAHAVFDLAVPSLFVTLEMSTESLMRRLLAGQAKIGLTTLRKGSYSETDFKRMASFQAKSAAAPMQMIDGGMGCAELCTAIRKSVRKHGTKLVVIDYLQIIRSSSKQEKRTYEIGDTAGRLKEVAKATGAVIICMCQLNRENEKEKGRMPRLADLGDSGMIERWADVVLLLHRDRMEKVGPAELIVAKQRDGETGLVPLTFLGHYCKFEPRAREPETQHHHD